MYLLDYTAVSDLRTVEHVWDELGRRPARTNHQINSLQDVQTTLIQEFQALSDALIQQYINLMRRRIVTVVRAQGGHTRF